MNGPSEFHVVGTLREWDITERLGEIQVPTLVVTGEHDEATPAMATTVRDGIPRRRKRHPRRHGSHMRTWSRMRSTGAVRSAFPALAA